MSQTVVEQKSKQKQNPTKREDGLDPDPMPTHEGMMFDRRESTNDGDNP